MNNNSKKHRGFTLIEVVISITILSIMSIAVYDGLMIIIKQTKAGQVKQQAALEGKKIIENMKASNFQIPDATLNIGNNTFQKEENEEGNISYTRYLDKDYSPCNKAVSQYKEEVTLTPAKALKASQTTGESVQLDTNGTLNSQSSKLYISKIGSQDYISYWKYNDNTKYVPANDGSKTPIHDNNQSQMEMYVYFTNSADGYQNINIKDYEGQDLLSITKTDKDDKDLVVNFSNYINSDGSVPTDKGIEVNVYNKTTDIPKIYIEKSQELNVNVEVYKGEINIYDNRSENPQEDNVGTLYDIKFEITEGNVNLFTGYYKKNIN